ncbi:thioesterase family protein [Ferruginibacter lapsinanis]|uniref:acyl-CoA thioesterase n=1 Tax=Ferruginibacter lapsinanis TaxID=563172 RepID=UPI001E652278|nr:thioesterase family protein [Ferruginibacter lapsinanis]UEG48522.1 thioesterase family protein [Ferruginibacter lapsinanis]
MARIKIVIPEKKIATVSIPVRIYDINYGNHVGNDSFVSIIHEARIQWLKQYNFSELNINGAAVIMRGLSVEFKSEAFYGDVLSIEISSGEISALSFELFYRITTTRNDKSILIAHAKTDMACFDYTKKKVMPVPIVLNEILGNNTDFN